MTTDNDDGMLWTDAFTSSEGVFLASAIEKCSVDTRQEVARKINKQLEEKEEEES